jgi:hypothetical protein
VARGIGTLAAAAELVLAVVGCAITGTSGDGNRIGSGSSGGSSGGTSVASCIAMLEFHHQAYGGTSLGTHPPYNHYGVIPVAHLLRIGVAVLPPCIDTDQPGIDDAPAAFQVARIDGVSPAIAIAALPRGDVYLRAGVKIPGILTTAPWIHWIFSD